MDKTNERIADKIRKLFALAQDPSNEHEAAAALMKAQELLDKYRLTESEVFHTAEEITTSTVLNATGGAWEGSLASTIGRAFDCCVIQARSYQFGASQRSFVYYGEKTDVELCQFVFGYLQHHLRRLADKYVFEHAGAGHPKSLRASYLMGAVGSLYQSVRAYKDDSARHVDYQAMTGQALVKVEADKVQRARQFVIAELAARGAKLGHARSSASISNGGAFYDGQRDGGNISLKRAINQGNAAKALNR